ncbi:MAG: hypothetical protein NZ557_03530, partial [Chthonomonadaceae bacterium]|nr:hypothetical protein [Chthonomonadaceae bacterium]
MASRSKSLDHWLRSPLTLALLLLALTGIVFGPTLASARQEVMAHQGTDLAMYFAHARAFAAQHLRQGHIPLWNPHICGGVPFVGAWQSGVFYPPNAIYLFLPLHLALNVELFLHVFLSGWFTALWARRYTTHPLACLLAGAMVMFSGAFFLHVYAGHCSLLAAGAWMPLFLASVDGLFLPASTQRPAPIAGHMFTGVLALAMMLLAGHPQTVFIAIVTTVLYSVALLPVSRFRIRALLALGILATGGVAIGAVQLLPGLQAASEGVRQGPLPYEMAASLSLLPQNLLTLLVPGFFGDMVRTPYWGGYFLWEMCLFAGGIGLTLAITGVTAGVERRRWTWLAMALLLLVLALGAHTPLFRPLYEHVPGFNRFRGHSKFAYPMTLFLALLAAQGLHYLLHSPGRARIAAFAAFLGALCLGGLGVLLLPGLEQELGLWKRLAYDLAA